MHETKSDWRSDGLQGVVGHVLVTHPVVGALRFCPQLGAATKNDLATGIQSVSTQEVKTN
jgi:hypothetical protein